MSVNEVKLSKATTALEVRGTGPPTSRTFCIGDEDHTLGNALRHILMQNAQVNFSGYSVPHPSEPVVHIRIQTKAAAATADGGSPYTASAALREGCQTLYDQCDIILQKLEEIMPEVREDKEKLEKIILEEGYIIDEEEEEEDHDEQEQQHQDDFHDEDMDMR
jgi:DNA-directed RNA polymerase I and III subunit RPAC2